MLVIGITFLIADTFSDRKFKKSPVPKHVHGSSQTHETEQVNKPKQHKEKVKKTEDPQIKPKAKKKAIAKSTK
jgi:hypothetical protein